MASRTADAELGVSQQNSPAIDAVSDPAESRRVRVLDEISDCLRWAQDRAASLTFFGLATAHLLLFDFVRQFHIPISVFSPALLPALPIVLVNVIVDILALTLLLVIPAYVLLIPLVEGGPSLIEYRGRGQVDAKQKSHRKVFWGVLVLLAALLILLPLGLLIFGVDHAPVWIAGCTTLLCLIPIVYQCTPHARHQPFDAWARWLILQFLIVLMWIATIAWVVSFPKLLNLNLMIVLMMVLSIGFGIGLMWPGFAAAHAKKKSNPGNGKIGKLFEFFLPMCGSILIQTELIILGLDIGWGTILGSQQPTRSTIFSVYFAVVVIIVVPAIVQLICANWIKHERPYKGLLSDALIIAGGIVFTIAIFGPIGGRLAAVPISTFGSGARSCVIYSLSPSAGKPFDERVLDTRSPILPDVIDLLGSASRQAALPWLSNALIQLSASVRNTSQQQRTFPMHLSLLIDGVYYLKARQDDSLVYRVPADIVTGIRACFSKSDD